MKNQLFALGDWLAEVGSRTGLRVLIYNPITWARFFVSGRRSGQVFAAALREEFPEVNSTLDVGAGTGGYVMRLRQAGYNAQGVEYSGVGRMLARLQGVRLQKLDCSNAGGMPVLGDVDAVYSIEVGEHLPEALARTFVQYLCSCSDLVIFSAASPGQGGQGHINEQPKNYWRDYFSLERFEYFPELSGRFAETLLRGGFRGWLPENVQIFRRRAQAPAGQH